MKTYNKKILLSVTGMSPAVVTETLYALVTEKGFIPDEIQVITTLQGRNQVLKTLCGIEGGRKDKKGALEEFIEDYGKQYGIEQIHFDESCIHIIEDENGDQLADIRTPAENNLAADKIVSLVGKLCSDENNQLHVSIAGGRKTMGFFMGYALSLYGREQDSLSHVLVSADFENLPSFYYPKPYSHKVLNDRTGQEFDAQQAKVMLAEIPWVCLGLGLPKHLQDQKVTYSESVSKAQEMLKTPKIQFLPPIESREVCLGDNTIVKLSHRGYAFLLALVLMKHKGLEFSLANEDEIKRLFVGIYDLLSIKELPSAKDFDRESIAALESFKRLIADARNDIVKKVQNAFYLGKGVTTPYIPSAVRENSKQGLHYDLLVDTDDDIYKRIKSDIAHLL